MMHRKVSRGNEQTLQKQTYKQPVHIWVSVHCPPYANKNNETTYSSVRMDYTLIVNKDWRDSTKIRVNALNVTDPNWVPGITVPKFQELLGIILEVLCTAICDLKKKQRTLEWFPITLDTTGPKQ